MSGIHSCGTGRIVPPSDGGVSVEFEKQYRRDAAAVAPPGDLAILDHIEPRATGIKDFFAKYSGATFNQGIYRVLPLDELRKWTAIATEMYTHLQGRMLVFASDWRGQLYALNATRKDGDQYQVQLLDPATGESLGIPATFATFHEVELIEYPNDSLQVELYQGWLAAGQAAPQPRECVGYIKPLQLGGRDEMANQEITDMEVYWSFSTQMKQQLDQLAPGTRIEKVDLE